MATTNLGLQILINVRDRASDAIDNISPLGADVIP